VQALPFFLIFLANSNLGLKRRGLIWRWRPDGLRGRASGCASHAIAGAPDPDDLRAQAPGARHAGSCFFCSSDRWYELLQARDTKEIAQKRGHAGLSARDPICRRWTPSDGRPRSLLDFF
jgi:hypothetical protein